MTLGGFFDYSTTLMWNRYCQAMAILIVPFYFKFSCSLIGIFEQNRKLFLIYLTIGVINALFLLVTPFYVQGLWSFGSYPYQPLGGPLYFIFTSYFVGCTLHGFVLAWKHYRLKQGIEKKHLQLFLWASAISYTGGFTLFLQGYHLPVPTTGVFLILVYVIIIGYSVFKYRFMDVEIIIKKTLVLTGLLTMVLAVVILVSGFINVFVDRYFLIPAWCTTLASALMVAGIYNMIRGFLVEVTDKYLFQKKINYRTLLREASEFLARVSDSESQSQNIVSFLIQKARIASASIYIVSGESLFLKASDPFMGVEDLKKIDSSHSIVNYFKNHHSPIEIQSLKEEKISNLMIALKAEAAIPCFSSDRIVAILFLGPQKSDGPYSEEDLDVFFTLGQEASIAFENSRLYDEALQKTKILEATQASLIAAEKTATMVGMAKAIGHEVNNPLATVVARAGFIYKEELKELEKIYQKEVKSTLPLETQIKIEKKLEKISDNAQRIDRSGKRIEVAVRTLTNILKDTQGEQGPQNFRVLWRECLEASRFSTSGCTFHDEIEPNLIIHGNNEQLIQVFTNLIKNAYEAMSGMKDPKITIIADKDPDDPQMAKIEFQDNGPGIPPSIQHKIWNQGFSTKSKPQTDQLGESGQGQGLYICKHLVESVHKGTMAVKSEPGKGTTFIVRLPLSEESIDGKY